MSYFSDNYHKLSFPIENGSAPGFRLPQLAALQAANAHLYSSPDIPAIIVMPTGSGKTAIINAIAFTQRAERVLVLTPSRLVREQIVEGFATLSDLRSITALPDKISQPKVFGTKGRIGTDEDWDSLREYDVVVATVPSVSPKENVIPKPPEDLFDLVLVDEAHHAPAASWAAILEHFLQVPRVLFTATPFRNDQREIQGKIVFVYDIRRAYGDRVFGDITYEPVNPRQGEDNDIAIAKTAERKLRADQSAGLKHLLMVRTDSRKRADTLKQVYAEHTGLNLKLIAGNQSLSHVKRVVEQLRSFQLDGVICVNMLAEGFNLPNLKVAAIHAPHRSLAVTLQFIGRFARTTASNVGAATFFAVPSEIKIETAKLYHTDAVWDEIVHNLSASRIEQEVKIREYLGTFEPVSTPDMQDFSLYSVRPYYHVKILSVPEGVNLKDQVSFPSGMSVVFSGFSEEYKTAIYITRESWPSLWSDDARLVNVEYEVFLIHYNAEAKLLFICASRRQESLYNSIAECVAKRSRLLSFYRLNRVLNDFDNLELFNVGMRNRSTLGNAESYRTVAGPAAHNTIQKSDGRAYDRGHCFGRATENGIETTIGVSGASKVWSNKSSTIPDLIEWCDQLATKIASGNAPVTNCGLDHLSAGDELIEIPGGVRVACWDKDTYVNHPQVQISSDRLTLNYNLIDFDLVVTDSDKKTISISLVHEDASLDVVFTIDANSYFSLARPDQIEICVIRGHRQIPLIDYLNEYPLSFYTDDLSRIEGYSIYYTPDELAPFDLNHFEVIDWDTCNVSMIDEKPPTKNGKLSIFEWMQTKLLSEDADIIFFDDSAGEIADFVTIKECAEDTLVTLYHCKGSGASTAGDRVDDAYDVCGQAIKSIAWTRPRIIHEQMVRRSKTTQKSQYLRGDEVVSQRLLIEPHGKSIQFEVVIVQPGFPKNGLSEKIANLVAAANDYLVRGNVKPLRLIGSA